MADSTFLSFWMLATNLKTVHYELFAKRKINRTGTSCRRPDLLSSSQFFYDGNCEKSGFLLYYVSVLFYTNAEKRGDQKRGGGGGGGGRRNPSKCTKDGYVDTNNEKERLKKKIKKKEVEEE